MGAVKQDKPHSINCLRAIEAFIGGRVQLAAKIGLSKGTIDQWVHRGRIPPSAVLKLTQVSDKFGAEELLGKFDDGGEG